MTVADTSRPLRKDAARNRAALIAAARTVFAERGLEASLDDIAREAGVGVGTAYRHFANKYELAQAIFAEAVERIVALAQQAIAFDDPWDGIVSFLAGTAEAQAADRGLREVLMGVHDEKQVEQVHDQLEGPMLALVDRAKAAGALRLDAEATDLGFMMMMLCTVADIAGDQAPDMWRRYLPMLLDGLRPGGAELPAPAIGSDTFRTAMKSHKLRLLRAGAPPDA